MRTDGVKIYLGLAEYAANNRMMKAYSLYLSAKAKYNHSIIYNFSYYKLAKIFKIDSKTAKRYVQKLLDHNFCVIHHGNLLFRSHKKVMDSNGLYQESDKGKRHYGEYFKLRIPANTTINQIYKKILEYRLSNNILQQEYNNLVQSGKIGESINLGSRTTNKASFEYLKNKYKNYSKATVIKALKSFVPYVSKEMIGEIIITSRSVGNLLGISHKAASDLLKDLELQNKISLSPVIEVVYKGINKDLSDSMIDGLKESGYGYYFWGSKTKSIYRYKGQAIIYKGDASNHKQNFVKNSDVDHLFYKTFGVDPETRNNFKYIVKHKRSPIQRKLRKKYYLRSRPALNQLFGFNVKLALNNKNLNNKNLNNKNLNNEKPEMLNSKKLTDKESVIFDKRYSSLKFKPIAKNVKNPVLSSCSSFSYSSSINTNIKRNNTNTNIILRGIESQGKGLSQLSFF